MGMSCWLALYEMMDRPLAFDPHLALWQEQRGDRADGRCMLPLRRLV